MIATINFESLKGIVGDFSEYFTLYFKHGHISITSLVSNVQRSSLTAGCSTWYPAHIEICKQCNINNTPNTKLHYSIEIKMLQSGVFWAMSPLGAESPQLRHIVITVAEAEANWKFWFVSNGFSCFLSPFWLHHSKFRNLDLLLFLIVLQVKLCWNQTAKHCIFNRLK